MSGRSQAKAADLAGSIPSSIRKSEFATGTASQILKLEGAAPQPLALDPANRLQRALMRLGIAVKEGKGAAPDGAAKGLAN
jgi:hypothetical protein